MSLQKANRISSARKSATSNLFIVFEFYDTLEKVMLEKQFLSSQIWNLDESGFPTDAGRCKVIAPKGEVANKITSGAGHENITVLAACNASGRLFNPLVKISSHYGKENHPYQIQCMEYLIMVG